MTEELNHKQIFEYAQKLDEVRAEIKKGIIGQEKVVDLLLKCILCRGHILFESVPGLAKTLLVSIVSKTMSDSSFQRIQFTPDLLPSDITGTSVYEETKGFYIIKGPIFANFVLADEINRAPPKVQSAMLQAMQEREVTIGRETFALPTPFMVLATMNPLEQMGVYPFSMAQLDRFFFKIFVDYPEMDEELVIIDNNTQVKKIEEFNVEEVISPQEIMALQKMVRQVHLSAEVKSYAIDLVEATRNPKKHNLRSTKYIKWGASPRASIFLLLGAKATALMAGRVYATPEDIRAVAHPVMRHRVTLSYEGKSREISSDEIIDEIIQKVPVL